jgi:hypothetical protein
MAYFNCSDYGKEGRNKVPNDTQMIRNKAKITKLFDDGNEKYQLVPLVLPPCGSSSCSSSHTEHSALMHHSQHCCQHGSLLLCEPILVTAIILLGQTAT